jgi:hypothetical protein
MSRKEVAMADQFLLLGIGDGSRIGGNIRVLAVASSEAEAKKKLDELDPSVLGHIALVEVKEHYERRPTVSSTPSDNPLFAPEKKK